MTTRKHVFPGREHPNYIAAELTSTNPELAAEHPERINLHSTDERILTLLTDGARLGLPTGLLIHKVTAIGRHHRTWTGADVLRIHRRYISGDTDPHQFHPHGWDGNTPRPDGTPTPRVTITHRQAQILNWLCQGHTITDITNTLGLHRSTIQQYIRSLVRTLDPDTNIKDRRAATEAIRTAVGIAQAGWVRLYIAENASRTPRDAAA